MGTTHPYPYLWKAKLLVIRLMQDTITTAGTIRTSATNKQTNNYKMYVTDMKPHSNVPINNIPTKTVLLHWQRFTMSKPVKC